MAFRLAGPYVPYVASSYLRNVPAVQRFGMTVWDVTDNDSWIVTSLHDVDYPTLFDGSYNKKLAFYQFLAGLECKIGQDWKLTIKRIGYVNGANDAVVRPR